MELIYLYIRKYEEIFENVEFNFSSNYVATMKGNQLIVEKNEKSIKNYYGDNVNNVVMFLGKNGMGKSTLLDILGMNRHDRIEDMHYRKTTERYLENSYFLLYHLYENYFAFEFVDDTFLRGESKISNIEIRERDSRDPVYKLPMGDIFILEGEIFKYSDNIILQWLNKNDIKRKLEYAYITADKYNYRVSNKYREFHEDYLFERKYYSEGRSYEHLYKYLNYLKDINNELLQDKKIIIENNIKVDNHLMDLDKNRGEYLYEKKKELDTLLHVKDDIRIKLFPKLDNEKEKIDSRSPKEMFIDTFCAEAIEFYFLEQFVGWSENEKKTIDLEKPDISLGDIKFLDESAPLMDFNVEYAHLKYKIEKNKDSDGNVNLKSVLKYVLSRVETAASATIDILDKKAVTEMLELLEKLPAEYFMGKKSICVNCETGEIDEKIVEFFKKYDFYYKVRNNETGSNCIYQILNIKLPKMSEGQRVFLDMIAKTISAIYEIEPGDSLVLLIDEPDRALHPEMARNFLAVLLENVNECKDRNIQIILSSHSPFIVTDILPEGVYSIGIENGKRKIINNENTYATNIYYLLMDSFMLENTFGEYSYRQITNIIQMLNSTEEMDKKKLKWIKNVIDRIGEPTVRRKMIKLYEKKDTKKNYLIDRLLEEMDERKIEKIKEILEKND